MLIYKHTDMWDNERLIDLKDHMSVNNVGAKKEEKWILYTLAQVSK